MAEEEKKKMTAQECRAYVEALPPKDFGRMVHCFAGRHDGAVEFPDLWPSLLALTEDEKTIIRRDVLGFPA